MLKEALSFYDNIQINNSLISEIMSINSEKIETMPDIDISKYCLCLAQYLVYFKYQINKARVEQMKLRRNIDYIIFNILTDDLIKKYKTKTDAKQHLIDNTPELFKMNDTFQNIEYELVLSEGIDKNILEMVNVLKKELSRREYEIGAVRYERKNRA